MRSELSQLIEGKNGSSESTHDAPTFGYRMCPKRLPNAELSSLRSAALTKIRLLKLSRSSPNRPSVTNSCVVSLSSGVTHPVSELVPEAQVRRCAMTPWNRL